ncbi:uncharacterized protein LOC134228618 isoform X2 [Saccostrea cucullata]|uniref:uncharacterized protein LOC134228618 isoform X2 n=1 Tax=Saccostrea cuccullata TaxID=36930 RepID=UPI002ED51DE7
MTWILNSNDGTCSALRSKSIYMNEDILEFIDNNDQLVESKTKSKECSRSSYYQNRKKGWESSHMKDRRETESPSRKSKHQRRLKGSKRMRKMKKKKQRWKRHKQKMG